MSVIFISHSAKDAASAVELSARLIENGHRSVFLDMDPENGLIAGQSWEHTLYCKLRSCDVVLALCSANYLASHWCFAEAALARMEGKHLITIRIEPWAPDLHLPSMLTDDQNVDLRTDKSDGYLRLWKGLAQLGIEPTESRKWTPGESPYPGLGYFDEYLSPVFFGREKEIRHAIAALEKLRLVCSRRLLAMSGSSGCGKSSVLRAGMVPRLRKNPHWIVLNPFRPGSEPLENLASVLAGAFKQDVATIIDNLTKDKALAKEIRRLRRLDNQMEAVVLLVIDQFEELLGTEACGEKTDAFLHLLRAALEDKDTPLVALITIRSDFVDTFSRTPALLEFDFENLPIKPMTVDGMRKVIEEPARLAQIRLEEGLVDRLLTDAGSPDSLVSLAFTLRELWEKGIDDKDRELELKEYEGLGGIHGVLALKAEFVYQQAAKKCSPDEIRRTFLKLARITEDEAFTRRKLAWDPLADTIREALQRFVDERLLVRQEEEGIVEVAHEALFRSWKRLVEWLEDGREILRLRGRLAADAREWKTNGKQAAYLYTGSRLTAAEELAAAHDAMLAHDEAAFLRAGVEQRNRRTAFREMQRQCLLDVHHLDRLAGESDEIWPAQSRNIGAMERWLTEAAALCTKLAAHETTLAQQSGPVPEEEDEGAVNDLFKRALTRLVDGLRRLQGSESGGIPAMRDRLTQARSLAVRSLDQHRDRWALAVNSIADPSQCPVYEALRLAPIEGLVPLARNPASGLWEFCFLLTGEIPDQRPADGRFQPGPEAGMVLVLLPGASFRMGARPPEAVERGQHLPNVDPQSDIDEQPIHHVKLAPFFMAKYLMTQQQWMRFTGTNPSHFRDPSLPLPVESVSWEEAERTLAHLGLRLPTEAQWEYACRAGTTTPYAGTGMVDDMAWYRDNSGGRTHPVGEKLPNQFGLYDMHGNVWEWCADWLGDYRHPVAAGDGERSVPIEERRIRVFRGGAFHDTFQFLRSSIRGSFSPVYRGYALGVRPVLLLADTARP